MKEWWNEKDFIKVIPEKIIIEDMSFTETVEMINKDILEHSVYTADRGIELDIN
ncbi:MAG: hypothetical protein RSC76_04200 [Oscillospiraceae bacterium]